MQRSETLQEYACEVAQQDLRLWYRLVRRLADGREMYDLIVGLEQGGERESCTLWDIAPDERKAVALYELFKSELVTPIHAEEVMAELLSDWEYVWG